MSDIAVAGLDLNNSIQDPSNNFRMKLIPAECLVKAKTDILNFFDKNGLNELEARFFKDDSMLDLPELSFKPVSIIIIAAKLSLKLAIFNYGSKRVTDLFRVREISIKDYLDGLFVKKGYNIINSRKLPQKRLAVCSGLAKYGKNNLAYIDGWGSFIQLETYLSDAPFDPEYVWQEVQDMEQCSNCGICMRKCPGGAITNDRFLLNMDKCHSWLEVSNQLPESAPRVIAPCSVCQQYCPKNSSWRAEAEQVEFTAEETECLFSIHHKPENPYSLSPHDVREILYSLNLSEGLVNKLMMLSIQPWTLFDIPNRLTYMFAHCKE